MLCFISNFPTFCLFWHATNADCQHKETKHKHIIFVYNIDQNFTYVCKILVNLLYFCISHLYYLISNLFSESVLCFIRQRAHKILDRLRLLPQEETWFKLTFWKRLQATACFKLPGLHTTLIIRLWFAGLAPLRQGASSSDTYKFNLLYHIIYANFKCFLLLNDWKSTIYLNQHRKVWKTHAVW